MWAAGYDHVDAVEALLSAGANVDLQDKRGMTALMIASEEGHTANVQKLLEHGAERTLKDHAGKTAGDHAAAGRSRFDRRATASHRISPVCEL